MFALEKYEQRNGGTFVILSLLSSYQAAHSANHSQKHRAPNKALPQCNTKPSSAAQRNLPVCKIRMRQTCWPQSATCDNWILSEMLKDCANGMLRIEMRIVKNSAVARKQLRSVVKHH